MLEGACGCRWVSVSYNLAIYAKQYSYGFAEKANSRKAFIYVLYSYGIMTQLSAGVMCGWMGRSGGGVGV